MKRVSQIDRGKVYTRGGIIPFLYHGGRRLFAFGLRKSISKIFDFGGHLESNETILEAAVREYQEESYDVLGKVTVADLCQQDCQVIDGFDHPDGIPSLEILWETSLTLTDIPRTISLFLSSAAQDAQAELKSIVWLSEEDLRIIYSYPSDPMWRRVRLFLTQHVLHKLLTWALAIGAI